MTRPHYRTKAEWAAAKAAECRERARALPLVPASNWRGVKARMRAQQSYRDDAARFERMAERFRLKGV